jgi:hypothetical protein
MTPWLDHSEPQDREEYPLREPGDETPNLQPEQKPDQYTHVLNRTSRTVPSPDQWETLLAPERDLAETVLRRMHQLQPDVGWDMVDDQDVLENLATLAAAGRAMWNCKDFCPGLPRCEAKEAGNCSALIPRRLELSASPHRSTARIDILWGPCKLKRQAALVKKQIQAERHEEERTGRGYRPEWR